MMRTLKSGLGIGMLVAAMALSAGCGDNDNGHGDNGNDNGGPIRTSTPSTTSTPGAATATPGVNPTATPTPTGGGQVNVGFEVASSAGVQGFDLRIAYPSAAGSFTGSGENVACTTTAAGSFIKNDNDTGTLTLIVANASNLTFPITFSCTFDATGSLAAGDLTVTVREVTQNGAPGDTTVLTVTPSVS
jgi:hypothetical protein